MTDSYIKGSTSLTSDTAPAFNNLGIDSNAYPAWQHLQGRLDGEITPCAGRLEWVSGKPRDKATAAAGCSVCPARAACAEYAAANNEHGATWGGEYRP